MRQDAGFDDPFARPQRETHDAWRDHPLIAGAGLNTGLYAEEEEANGETLDEVGQDADTEYGLQALEGDHPESTPEVELQREPGQTPAQGGAGAVQDALSASERVELAMLESVIEEGIQQFITVGKALASINQLKLYRETHKSFSDYVENRWGWSVRNAYHYIDAAEVAENVKTSSHLTPQLSVAVELSKAETGDQQMIWEGLTEGNGASPTVRSTRKAVRARKALRQKTNLERYSEEIEARERQARTQHASDFRCTSIRRATYDGERLSLKVLVGGTLANVYLTGDELDILMGARR